MREARNVLSESYVKDLRSVLRKVLGMEKRLTQLRRATLR
jgi:hypothetical protein